MHSVELINQNVSTINVFMAEWVKHKIENLRRTCWSELKSKDFANFCLIFYKLNRCEWLTELFSTTVKPNGIELNKKLLVRLDNEWSATSL